MQSRIDQLLAPAITAISNCAEIKKSNSKDEIKGIYESYLSQFGPMVIQIGLKSTLAVYFKDCENVNEGKGNRAYILSLLYQLYPNKKPSDYKVWIKGLICTRDVISQVDEDILLDLSVALKRAIRTFNLIEDKTE